MVNKCSDCGLDMNLVGKRHNCKGPTTLADVKKSAEVADKATTGKVVRKRAKPVAAEQESSGPKATPGAGRAGAGAVMSISLSPQLKRRIKMYAAHMGEPTSTIITRLIEDHLREVKWSV